VERRRVWSWPRWLGACATTALFVLVVVATSIIASALSDAHTTENMPAAGAGGHIVLDTRVLPATSHRGLEDRTRRYTSATLRANVAGLSRAQIATPLPQKTDSSI
jgi:hypothetical protein